MVTSKIAGAFRFPLKQRQTRYWYPEKMQPQTCIKGASCDTCRISAHSSATRCDASAGSCGYSALLILAWHHLAVCGFKELRTPFGVVILSENLLVDNTYMGMHSVNHCSRVFPNGCIPVCGVGGPLPHNKGLVLWTQAKRLVPQHVVVHARTSKGTSQSVELIENAAHAPNVLSALPRCRKITAIALLCLAASKV